MLPYLQLQAVHLILSGILAAVSFLIAGLVFRTLFLLRYLSALGSVCVLSVVLLIAARIVLQDQWVSGFGVVALVFYAGAFWLPLLCFTRIKKTYKTRGLTRLVAVGSVLLGVVAMFIEPNRLVQREEHVLLGAWEEGSRPLRIAHISDLQTVGACEREREAARIINEYQPDFVVITGDYIAGPFWNTDPAVSAARQFLSELKPKIATIAIDGHSERPSDQREVLADLDVIYLENEERVFELGDGRSISFLGLHVDRPDFVSLERPRKPGEVRLVASHLPDVTHALTGLDVDIHLAGHTHGGQIVIPGFGPPITMSSLPREYARGLRRIGDHWIHASAGIGMEGNHAPRIRLFCPPEVSFVVIGGSREVQE